MEGITIRQVTVTQQAARAILTTAIEAGSYGTPSWARVVKTGRRDGWIYRVELEDCEQKRAALMVVTDTEIRIAVETVLRDPAKCEIRGAKVLGRIVLGDFDGQLADEIVQVACFGKVIYG